MKTSVVELKNISKQYSGSDKKANNNISLDLYKGEILCIAGENGAGKTTLMKILCGLETPDAGEIFINKKKEIINSALDANKLGIGMVHQHFMLFPEYTVAENIVMGIEPRKWGIFIDTKKANNLSDKIIKKHNFVINSTQKVKDLTLGQMQQTEICRTLYRNADIIILDEPTSILTEYEIKALFETLKKIALSGKSIVMITHKLHEIKDICDRAAVMNNGELVGIRESTKIDESEIAGMMTGIGDNARSVWINDFSRHTAKKTLISRVMHEGASQNQNSVLAAGSSDSVISFDNVTVVRRGQKQPLLDKVSFSVKSKEILGFTGVGGNGLGVIEAVLGGFLHPAEGKILYKGNDISNLSIHELRKEGLAYVPADRLKVGSARDTTIEENIIINRRHDFTKKIFIDKNAAGAFSKNLVQSYNIEGVREGGKCAILSGGNLQKLILAREINYFRDYIVFSEPTWGLDFASSRYIMKKIIELRNKRAAVILISTNLDEILSLADRIIVMYRGRAAAEFDNSREAE